MAKVLIFNWKDIRHPQAGGAETVIWELAKRMVGDSHEVVVITSSFQGAKPQEFIDEIEVIRLGNYRWLHPLRVVWWYLWQGRNRYDILIEAVNTVPYFVNFFKGQEKVVLLYHQLAREVWFWETRFPLNILGFWILEPLATWLQSLKKTRATLVMSESTRKDLQRFGFARQNLVTLPELVTLAPLKTLQDGLPKEKEFTIIYCGSLRRMKRSMEALRAFLIFIRSNPQAKLWFVGGGNPLERAKLEEVVRQYTLEKSVTFFGTVSEQEKANLLQRAHVLTVTSVKEGWGLVVTEAGMCGTPAVVYNVDGLRDSCLDGVTGLVVPNNSPQALSQAWQKLYDRPDLYHRLRRNALRWNSQYTAEGCYEIFSQAIGLGR